MHNFDDSQAKGKPGEDELDRLFSRVYEIHKVTRSQQRNEIDRVFIRRDTRMEYTIEYKCDFKAEETGNAFIETVSVSTSGAPGWVLKSHAQWLVYYLPISRVIRWVPMLDIKQKFAEWFSRYGRGLKEIPNRGRGGGQYITSGFPVPFAEFDRLVRWKRTTPKRTSDIS